MGDPRRDEGPKPLADIIFDHLITMAQSNIDILDRLLEFQHDPGESIREQYATWRQRLHTLKRLRDEEDKE